MIKICKVWKAVYFFLDVVIDLCSNAFIYTSERWLSQLESWQHFEQVAPENSRVVKHSQRSQSFYPM